MSIEMKCTGCGQTLRVGDDHAGKKARCPACGTITQVPASGSQAPVEPAVPDFGGAKEPAMPANPFADRPESANPYQSPTAQSGASLQPGLGRQFLKPHRGGLVLTFGLLGIFCCMPFGIAAWVMGASDLGQIRNGRMDPSGQSITQAGMILGIISVVLAVVMFLFSILAEMA